MQNPFWNSAGPRFVDRDEIFLVAREAARRIAAKHQGVKRVLLFGSFARGDYGIRSDLDLLVIVSNADKAVHERLTDYLEDAPDYPTDMLVYTEHELRCRLAEENGFLCRAMREAIQLYP
jgi:predicted nucleotidyltransferase